MVRSSPISLSHVCGDAVIEAIGGCRKLQRMTTRRQLVNGDIFLDSNNSFGCMHPEIGLSRHVHVSATASMGTCAA